MKKKVRVKVLFPYNWFEVRNIRISDKNGLIAKVPVNSDSIIEIDKSTKELIFRIDLYRSKIILLNVETEEVFVSVYFNISDYFPLDIIQGMLPNSLMAKEIGSLEKYNELTHKTYYKSAEEKVSNLKLDIFNIIYFTDFCRCKIFIW